MRPNPVPPRALPWVVVGIVLMALSLRGPIIAPTPVMIEIQADLGLSAAVAGLVTGLPVLLFALTTPLASRLIGRAGPEVAVLVCLAGILAGTAIRSAGPAPVVMAGTVVIGAAIAVGNIVVPVIIRRDVPWRRIFVVTAAYTAALNLGSMITSLGTAPLAAVLGWRWALAAWGVFALAGMLFWAGVARRRSGTPPRSPAVPGASAAPPGTNRGTAQVRRIGRLLTLAFCGQAFSYFTVTAWLPTLLADTRGLSLAASGASASLFQVAAISGALGVPLLAARTPPWAPVAVIGALWVTLPLGLLVAPQGYVLWSFVGGVAQGGGFTVIFSIVARIVRSDAEAATTSARIQASGYLAATVGPPLLGALSSATGTWTVPLLVVLGATLMFLIGGLLAVRETERRRP
ncbi:CynX/NimT family MFS transporter [Kocuria sp. M1R5S2]|uniref:MFS transporter n=1 Tax=Kocuria rhizosphaerae TaxID=3376285 RepID=UPI00379F7AD6